MSLVSVLTQNAALPSRESVERAARDFFPRESMRWRETNGLVEFGVEGMNVAMRAVAGPVPNAEADTSAFLSLSSVNGRWRLGSHAAHLLLALEGPPLLPNLTRFTKLVAAVTRSVPALGVHWGGGPVTHSPDFFTEIARDAPLPIPLWVGVSVTPEPGSRTSLLSFGMAQVKLPELLLTAANAEMDDALDFFFSALATVAERGFAPEDGERIPRSLFSRPRVSWGESPVEAGKRVWKLEL